MEQKNILQIQNFGSEKPIKFSKKKIEKLGVVSLLLIIILIPLISLKFTGFLIKEQQKQVEFYFYDEITNCSLNAYVFIGNKLIGKSEQGIFKLTKSNYQENIENLNIKSNISIFGRLGNCFQESDLFFNKYWESFEIQDYYFDGESTFNFKTKINPNNPVKRELQGFIQPDKIKYELDNINLNNQDTINDLSKINQYLNNKINYKKDWNFNKQTNYWQTTQQTLETKSGDCEDYSTALLSLFLSYNNQLNCYNIVFTSHVTTFCYINGYYIYYDQGKIELKKQINNKQNPEQTKSKLTKLKQDYFEHYGIDGDNETIAHYAFNDNEYIEFNSDDDFINWQFSLENQKQDFDLFQNLEQQAIEAEELYNQLEYRELATQQPGLSAQKPSIRGFIKENPIILISLSVIFIILIIILIKINKKKKIKY